MARYTGPKCRLCRREGVKLFLKGTRCEGPMCAVTRRQQPPGQHGAARRRQSSDYGVQLREKQKTKRVYGVLEKQFRTYVKKAENAKGDTGEFLLQLLERRADNVIYRLGLAHSRNHAKQLITQGKFSINGEIITIPSFIVKLDDVITCNKEAVLLRDDNSRPSWVIWNLKKKEAQIKSLPKRDDVTEPIEEHLIVEFYSR